MVSDPMTVNGNRIAKFVSGLATLCFSMLATAQASSSSGTPGAIAAAAGAAASSPSFSASTLLYPSDVSYKARTIKGSSVTFRVRSDLSLQLTMHYTFVITPQMSDSKAQTYAVPNGYYLMRMLVMLPEDPIPSLERKRMGLPEQLSEQERFISYFEQLVKAENGVIKPAVDFVFNDPTTLRSQTDLYIQIVPIQQESIRILPSGGPNVYDTSAVVAQSLPYPSIIKVPFIPQKTSDSNPVASPNGPGPVDSIAASFEDTVKRLRRQRTLLRAPIENEVSYAQKRGYVLTTTDSPLFHEQLAIATHGQSHNFNYPALSDLVALRSGPVQPLPQTPDPSLVATLCGWIGRAQNTRFGPTFQSSKARWIEACNMDPYSHLSFIKTVHIKSMNELATGGQVEKTYLFNTIANFSANHTFSADQLFSVSSGASIFPLAAAGLSLIPLSVSYSLIQAEDRSNTNSGMSQSLKQSRLTSFVTQIPMNRYTTCLAVEPLNWQAFLQSPLTIRGLYICEGEKQNSVVQERYYYSSEDIGDVPDASNQAAQVFFRGERDYAVYTSILQRFAQTLPDNGNQIDHIYSNAAAVFANSAVGAPGVIAYPMDLESTIENNRNPDPVKNPGVVDYVKSWFK